MLLSTQEQLARRRREGEGVMWSEEKRRRMLSDDGAGLGWMDGWKGMDVA